jgi:hypothetical protein
VRVYPLLVRRLGGSSSFSGRSKPRSGGRGGCPGVGAFLRVPTGAGFSSIMALGGIREKCPAGRGSCGARWPQP